MALIKENTIHFDPQTDNHGGQLRDVKTTNSTAQTNVEISPELARKMGFNNVVYKNGEYIVRTDVQPQSND